MEFLLYRNDDVCKPLSLCKMEQLLTLVVKPKKALLSANFGDDRVISRHFPDAWPSSSFDFNPWDFLILIKDRVCRGGIMNLPDLKASIIHHVAEIPRELLRATIENAILCFQHVIDVSGAHIEHIL
ncbi:uncharacterized protein TNCV_5118731 [Trichonephila clavipes]|nr:uncharacterized protein TNCV_5118731 [Trichonephila clavipes]